MELGRFILNADQNILHAGMNEMFSLLIGASQRPNCDRVRYNAEISCRVTSLSPAKEKLYPFIDWDVTPTFYFLESSGFPELAENRGVEPS